MGTRVSGMHNAKVPPDDRCRDRIGELMAGDDDQRQVERVTSRATVDVGNEIPCPEAGEEVDVGEPSVQPRSVSSRGRSATTGNTVSFHVRWKNSQFPQ